MQNINWFEVLLSMGAFTVMYTIVTVLMKQLRKHKIIREPIGKYGWGFVKDDFKVRWIMIVLVCVVLAVIFYFIYRYSVQFA